MESVRCARAMRRGIGQRIDDLQLLDDRSGPSVRDDERQRIFMFRTNVNEMNVQPIDLGHELRQGVQSRLALAPIVIRRPIARELLHRRELHALRFIRDVSRSGHRVASMRRRRSTSASSGTLTRKGRMGLSSVAASDPEESTPAAPAAAEAARKLRRVGDDVNPDTIVLPDRKGGLGVMATREGPSIAEAAGKRPFAIVSACELLPAAPHGRDVFGRDRRSGDVDR